MYTLESLEDNLVNERKFSGSVLTLPRAKAILDLWCEKDSQYPVNRINSIYFDTFSSQSYDEKANGDNIKLKLRCRWYGTKEELEGKEKIPLFIELKHRLGSARRKERFDVEVDAKWISNVLLSSMELQDFIYEKACEIDGCIPRNWVPVMCICYDRIRYVCKVSQSRVSLDYNIHVNRINKDLFPNIDSIKLDDIVCEFKNKGGTPPPWAYEMQMAGLRIGSFSKYGHCFCKAKEELV